MDGGTFPGEVFMTFGGVGRNLADCLDRLDHDLLFISAVGNDFHGELVHHRNPTLNVSGGIETLNGQSTAVCCVILDKIKECSFNISDMKIHQQITPEKVSRYESDILRAPLVVIDGNISVETMDYVLDVCQEGQVPVWFEPTDVNKAAKIFQTKSWTSLCFASPNVNELRRMHEAAFGTSLMIAPDEAEKVTVENLVEECVTLSRPFMEHLNTLVVTLGHEGLLLVTWTPDDKLFPLKDNYIAGQMKEQNLVARYFPPFQVKKQNIVSVSGAGDCLAGAIIGAILNKQTPHLCMKAGLHAAQLSLLSQETVPSSIKASAVYHQPQPIKHIRIDI